MIGSSYWFLRRSVLIYRRKISRIIYILHEDNGVRLLSKYRFQDLFWKYPVFLPHQKNILQFDQLFMVHCNLDVGTILLVLWNILSCLYAQGVHLSCQKSFSRFEETGTVPHIAVYYCHLVESIVIKTILSFCWTIYRSCIWRRWGACLKCPKLLYWNGGSTLNTWMTNWFICLYPQENMSLFFRRVKASIVLRSIWRVVYKVAEWYLWYYVHYALCKPVFCQLVLGFQKY